MMIWNAFLRHIYRSIEIANHNAEMAIEYIQSALDHFLDTHEFGQKYSHIQQCTHPKTSNKTVRADTLDLSDPNDAALYAVSEHFQSPRGNLDN